MNVMGGGGVEGLRSGEAGQRKRDRGGKIGGEIGDGRMWRLWGIRVVEGGGEGKGRGREGTEGGKERGVVLEHGICGAISGLCCAGLGCAYFVLEKST